MAAGTREREREREREEEGAHFVRFPIEQGFGETSFIDNYRGENGVSMC